ncbi:MAG: polysaccharide biosynthesis tyrosine autokinase [Anaerolineales bacterium]|nr:polysaccharide biosynthesis tyrosine autokinase [Anaerolineales bacterium]
MEYNNNNNEEFITTQEIETIDIRQYLWILWRYLWLIVLAGILGAGVAYYVSVTQTPIYQSTTTVLINESAAKNAVTDYTTILASERLTKTYSEMLVKTPVMEEVARRLNLKVLPDDLQKRVEAQPVRDTQLVKISVEDPNPYLAAAIANTLVEVFSDQIKELQTSRFSESKANLQEQIYAMEAQISQASQELAKMKEQGLSGADALEARLAQYQQIYASLVTNFEQIRLAEAQSATNIIQVEPARADLVPVRPQVLRNTLLAGFVAVVLAIGLVFLFEFLDDTVKDPDQIIRATELPILATIGRINTEKTSLVAQFDPLSPIAESFRRLRTNIRYSAVDEPIRRLLVTSPTPKEGKTTVATNLAVILAQDGLRTILIDGDLRRPTIQKLFRSKIDSGLSTLFVHPELSVDLVLKPTNIVGFQVLPCGERPPNPAELLGSKRMSDILSQAEAIADMVVIDSPPVLSVIDAAVLATLNTGVLIVIQPGSTKQRDLMQTVEQLRRVKAKILGLVLVDIKARYARYYRSYYSYDYYYEYVSEEKKTAPRKRLQETAPQLLSGGRDEPQSQSQ